MQLDRSVEQVVPLDELQSGMTISRNVVSDRGCIVLAAGQTVTPTHLERLRHWHGPLSEVYVAIPTTSCDDRESTDDEDLAPADLHSADALVAR
jgi:hypothetical protein